MDKAAPHCPGGIGARTFVSAGSRRDQPGGQECPRSDFPSFVHIRAPLWLCALALGLSASRGTAQPQFVLPGAVQSRSHSGQFIVQAQPSGGERSRLISALENNRNFVRLDASLLPVSCERIKQIVCRQLGIGAPWTGRIFLNLYPAVSGEDQISLASGRFRDGWQYRLELPDVVERSRYVRSVIEVLLLEIANRSAADHSAEVPVWLSEGLCRQLLLANELEIILPPPRADSAGLRLATTVVNARKENPLEPAHTRLCASPALTFQQLSWPASEQLLGEEGEIYRSSAQLFVHELLSLKEGPACLQAMLAELPQHYNWQFAFLHAFRPYFQRPLDIEKWWALHLEHFTGRDLAQAWPAAESWEKFDAVICSAVQVRSGSSQMPMSAEVKLQTVIREWDGQRQIEGLQAKVRELQQLRLRLPQPFAPLAERYHGVLVTYLEHLDQARFLVRRKAFRRQAADEATRELNRLDAELANLRPLTAPDKTRPADSPALTGNR